MKKDKVSTSLAMVRSYFPNVVNVQDALKPAVVEVTHADNNNSVVKSHQTCALALACKRFFKADGVIIGLTTSWIIHGKTAHRYKNAPSICREIVSFDRKAGFDVGFYGMTPFPETQGLGVKHTPKVRPTGKGKPRSFRHYTRNVRTSLHGGNPGLA